MIHKLYLALDESDESWGFSLLSSIMVEHVRKENCLDPGLVNIHFDKYFRPY